MLKKITLTGLTAIAALWGCAHAQAFFDFGQIDGLPDEPAVQIDLNTTMLGFVREMMRPVDAEAAGALDGLEAVRVLVYMVDDAEPMLDYIDEASEALERADWQRMVYVQAEDHRVRVYLSFNDTRLAGLTMMVAGEEEEEAVFINIVGEIDPAQLGRVARAVGLEHGLLPNVVTSDGVVTEDEEQD